MREIKAPNKIKSDNLLFLAGSIEMGKAENWQERAMRLLEDSNWIILNPRRDDWDSSWTQSITNPQFCEQVEWELDAQEKAEKILMYFDVTTKSPISLLELGLFAQSGKMIVVCPSGFWRKGNVDIVCRKYGIMELDTLEEAIDYLKNVDKILNA